MIRLLYFSTAKPNLEPAEIDSIVAISQTNNENRDITGALTYNGRNFCQLLEGDEIAVRDLVEVIRTTIAIADSRSLTRSGLKPGHSTVGR